MSPDAETVAVGLDFPLTFAECGGDMRILAFITAAEPVDAILNHLGLPPRHPPTITPTIRTFRLLR